ncbi:MAG: lamin tail domain-containing protein [Patescibacteria group bacterium]
MARGLLFSWMVGIFLAGNAWASGPVINEVFFDPEGTDTGAEWIEIYNPDPAPVVMTGWQIYPAGIGYFTFPSGFTLGPKQFAVIMLRSSGTNVVGVLYHATALSNMGNTSGSVALFSAEPRGEDTIRSFVQWGEGKQTWESAAVKTGLLTPHGAFVPLDAFSEGKSLALANDGVAGSDVSLWKTATLPTKGATNNAVAAPAASSTASVPTPAVSANVSALPPPLAMEARAGRDRTAVVGADIVFEGMAIGLLKEPIENARFWWNFGDGGTAEGRAVSHAFKIPGTYMTGLHVSSGMYAASDYSMVNVVPNKVAVTEVTKAEEGFVRLRNGSPVAVDIGGWTLEEAGGRRFVLPLRTMISAGGEIALAHTVTMLTGALPITMSFPDGSSAFSYPSEPAAPGRTAPPISVPAVLSSAVGIAPESLPGKPVIKEQTAVPEKLMIATSTLPLASVKTPIPSSGYISLFMAFSVSIAASAGFLFLKKFFI